jgi:prenyltransferase beta subunit
MTLGLEMLQVARLAPTLLGDSSALIADFVQLNWHSDGGACDRAGNSDLYYTVFALETLRALQVEFPPTIKNYLASFADGAQIDFVHRCCLARCLAITDMLEQKKIAALSRQIQEFRSRDGGFAQRIGEASGNAYAAYLAIAALQDLGAPLPAVEEIMPSLHACRANDGGYGQHAGATLGTTPTTVSAIMVHHAYDVPVAHDTLNWLYACRFPQGGFRAHHQAPMPDLLSTATALHALACAQRAPTATEVEGDLDFIDTLWTNKGAFHGHWAEDDIDVEYTYYGLLALGHLSLPT